MPHLELTFIFSQMFWLLVTFAICYFVISRYFVPKISRSIDEREENIKNNLNEAEKLAEQSQDIKNEIIKMNLKAVTDAEKIRNEAAIAAQIMINDKIEEVNKLFIESVKVQEKKTKKSMAELQDQLPIIVNDVKDKVTEIIFRNS